MKYTCILLILFTVGCSTTSTPASTNVNCTYEDVLGSKIPEKTC